MAAVSLNRRERGGEGLMVGVDPGKTTTSRGLTWKKMWWEPGR
jgi:hypothetical protein